MPRNLSILLHLTAVHCPTAHIYLFVITPTLSRHPVYSSVRSATVPYSMQCQLFGYKLPKDLRQFSRPLSDLSFSEQPLALSSTALYSKLKMEPFKSSILSWFCCCTIPMIPLRHYGVSLTWPNIFYMVLRQTKQPDTCRVYLKKLVSHSLSVLLRNLGN